MIYRRKRGLASYAVKPFLVGLLLCGCFLTVGLRSNITTVEYRIGELEKEKMEVMKERKALVADRAEALSILEVEQVAMNRLGLDFPVRTRLFSVQRDEGGIPYVVSFRVKE